MRSYKPRLLKLLEQSIWRANDITLHSCGEDETFTLLIWHKAQFSIQHIHFKSYCYQEYTKKSKCKCNRLLNPVSNMIQPRSAYLQFCKGIHNGCVLPKTSMTGPGQWVFVLYAVQKGSSSSAQSQFSRFTLQLCQYMQTACPCLHSFRSTSHSSNQNLGSNIPDLLL